MKVAPDTMKQGTDDWHAWRKQGIGGSDIATIMGLSPWKTRFQLWEEKTGRSKPFLGNYATDRGNRLEPYARANFELRLDMEMPPALAVHPEYPYMRVSLDGFSAAPHRVLEIKCPLSKTDHETALEGRVPEKYICQVQYQLACTGAEQAFYFSYSPDHEDERKRGAVVLVQADPLYQAQLIEAARDFWTKFVITDTPPALSPKDTKVVRDASSKDLATRWRFAKEMAANAKKELDVIERVLLEKFKDEQRVEVSGVLITKRTRKGPVEYAKIPELRGVDLEIYRKPSSDFMEIRLKEKSQEEPVVM